MMMIARPASTSALSSLYIQAFQSNPMKWAIGSWSFFIAENLVLTENRSFIIERLFHGNEEQYHYLYGILSTIACGSIGYAYVYKILPSSSLSSPSSLYLLWPIGSAISPLRKLTSFFLYSLGLGILSQVPPKLQMPVTYHGEMMTSRKHTTSQKTEDTSSLPIPISEQQQQQQHTWRVRCPFDFTTQQEEVSKNVDGTDAAVRGIDRISRHAGLWSFGFLGLGQACLTSSIPAKVWFCMPSIVAAIGGWHIDSRYRRGLGGTMPSDSWEKQTSHIPFLAWIRNGIAPYNNNRNTTTVQTFFQKECKGSNAMVAVILAAGIVLRQGRGGGSALAAAATTTAQRWKHTVSSSM
jgi:hypothetical protein